MNFIVKSFAFLILASSAGLSQQPNRDQVVRNVEDLKSQIEVLKGKIASIEKGVLQPDSKDIEMAQQQGVSVIRLLPREKYDGLLAIHGGGAYYSFFLKSQEYGRGSDIELQGGKLSVGFAGADYGFLIDLGEIELGEINRDEPRLDFLVKYMPPTYERDVRAEQTKSHNYDVNGIVYTRDVPAVVGHTYPLRSISIDDSDLLVALKVLRKDSDGSLITNWKPLETFAKPIMLNMPDKDMKAAIDRIIESSGLRITIEVKDNILVWRGSPTGDEINRFRTALRASNIRVRGEDLSQRSNPR